MAVTDCVRGMQFTASAPTHDDGRPSNSSGATCNNGSQTSASTPLVTSDGDMEIGRS
jgi:hypothetical protein